MPPSRGFDRVQDDEDGGLVTFPAPHDWGRAVRLHKVDGTYERGSSRTNPDEARAVSRFVVDQLRTSLDLEETQRPTLGVVPFNIQQQPILDHLATARGDDDRLEWFFSEDREEPVIVKNLENIRGDERDVMVFSTTFGRDAASKLSMNQDGRRKRLNVAVTRAPRERCVCSRPSRRPTSTYRPPKRRAETCATFSTTPHATPKPSSRPTPARWAVSTVPSGPMSGAPGGLGLGGAHADRRIGPPYRSRHRPSRPRGPVSRPRGARRSELSFVAHRSRPRPDAGDRAPRSRLGDRTDLVDRVVLAQGAHSRSAR